MIKKAHVGASSAKPFISDFTDGYLGTNGVLKAAVRTNKLHLQSGATRSEFYRGEAVVFNRLNQPEARYDVFANMGEERCYKILHELIPGARAGYETPKDEVKAKVSGKSLSLSYEHHARVPPWLLIWAQLSKGVYYNVMMQ